jgi:hypothetical protein
VAQRRWTCSSLHGAQNKRSQCRLQLWLVEASPYHSARSKTDISARGRETGKGTASPHLQEEVEVGETCILENELRCAFLMSRTEVMWTARRGPRPGSIGTSCSGRRWEQCWIRVRVGVPAGSSTSPSRRWPGCVVRLHAAPSSTVPCSPRCGYRSWEGAPARGGQAEEARRQTAAWHLRRGGGQRPGTWKRGGGVQRPRIGLDWLVVLEMDGRDLRCWSNG